MKSAIKKFSFVFGFFFVLNTLYLLLVTPAAYAAASLSLSPATTSQNVGDTWNVDIVVDTGGDPVAGATALLTYDTTKLSVVGTALTAGPFFNQAPLTNTIDSTAGQIRYDSGSLGTPPTGRGVIATIKFKAITAGTAQVNFVFNPSSTTNTSIVAAASGPTNLLTTVNNGTYTIGSGVSTPLPKTGAVENTIAVIAFGLVFLGIGIVLARKSLVFS